MQPGILTTVSLGVHFVLSQNSFAQLTPSQRDELAALTAISDAAVYLPNTMPETSEARHRLPLIVEIGNAQHAIRWAASHTDAMAPTSHWGGGEDSAQFVRVYHNRPLSPLPTEWRRIGAAELRSTLGGLCEIAITTELNGSHRQFGQRAWQLVFDRAPALQQQFSGSQPLIELHYSDRYLRSPFTALLLRELVGSLVSYPGGLVDNTRIAIATSELRRNDTQVPRWLHNDWQDAIDRRQVFEEIFNGLGQFSWQEARYAQLPHARELHLTWADGTIWTLRFDQGVGYWWADDSRKPFPFERSVEDQIEWLQLCEVDIKAGHASYPTYWYVGPV